MPGHRGERPRGRIPLRAAGLRDAGVRAGAPRRGQVQRREPPSPRCLRTCAHADKHSHQRACTRP
eukprot:13399003-Alexandrium_andersonii.AAC.1